MKMVYLNKNRRFNYYKKGFDFGRYRRFDNRSFSVLSKVILFWVLFIIAVRMGSLTFFLMFDYPDFHYQPTGWDVFLPEIRKPDVFIKTSGLAVIGIKKDGMITINNYRFASETDMSLFLKGKKIENPRMTVYFLVDRGCNMEHVNKMIDMLIELDIHKVIFVTLEGNLHNPCLHRT